MTDNEKVLSWPGEKVTLVPLSGDLPLNNCHGAGGKRLPGNDYGGRTGAIIEAKPSKDSSSSTGEADLVIALDTRPETISCSSTGSLVFSAEMNIAQALVGRSFWTKGSVEVKWRVPGAAGIRHHRTAPAERVTFTKATTSWNSIDLHLITAGGQEGWLEVMEVGGVCLDGRFHLNTSCRRVWSPSTDFYEQDPRKLYAAWSQAIWGLVAKGEVAIGMTEQMVEAACGANKIGKGFVITGDVAGAIFQCGQRKFLIQGGKVTKYVE